MIQKIALHFSILTSAIIFTLFALSAISIQKAGAQNADIPNSTCQGAQLKFSDNGPAGNECQFAGDKEKPAERVNSIIATIINIFSVVVGVVAVIMIIVGGFRYITSGGDSGNVTSAKNTILYAIVGLIIVALAQFIVKFVLAKATTTT